MFGELEGDVLTESLFEETLLVGPGMDLNGATQPCSSPPLARAAREPEAGPRRDRGVIGEAWRSG